MGKALKYFAIEKWQYVGNWHKLDLVPNLVPIDREIQEIIRNNKKIKIKRKYRKCPIYKALRGYKNNDKNTIYMSWQYLPINDV